MLFVGLNMVTAELSLTDMHSSRGSNDLEHSLLCISHQTHFLLLKAKSYLNFQNLTAAALRAS